MAPCDTRNNDGANPLYSPGKPSVPAMRIIASKKPLYGAPAADGIFTPAPPAPAPPPCCNASRVLTTQIGFVMRLTTAPASAALARCRCDGNDAVSTRKDRR